MLSTVKSVMRMTATVMNSAELLYEMSMPPTWSGTIRSIMNWCRGETCSSATLVLFRLILVPRRLPVRTAIPHGHAQTRHRAVNIEHARGDAQQHKHDYAPGFRPQVLIESPTDAEAEYHGDHQLQTNAEAEAQRAVERAITLYSVTGRRSRAVATRLVEAL